MDDWDELNKDLRQYISALKDGSQQFFDLAREARDVLFSVQAQVAQKDPAVTINRTLYDGSGERALDIYASGVASNTATSSNTWQTLRYEHEDINRRPGVAAYQEEQENSVYSGLARGNFYEVYFQFIREAAWAGASAMFAIPDKVQKVVLRELVPFGTFWVQRGRGGEYVGFHREFYLSGKECLKLFPKASTELRDRWTNGKYQKFAASHTVRERDTVDYQDRSNKGFRFESVYRVDDKIVDVGGNKKFPYIVHQPDPIAGTNWGLSPAIRALRDAGVLQAVAETDLHAKQRLADPPRETLSSYEYEYLTDPGADNPVTREQLGNVSRPVALGVNPQITDAEMGRLRTSVEAYFKVPFFLQTAMLEKQVTRAEFLGRQAADMATLAPMIDRLCSEVLDLVVMEELEYQNEFELLPEPPPYLAELKVQPLSVVYNSPMLTLIKRAHTLAGVEHFQGFLGNMIKLFPDEAPRFKTRIVLDRMIDKAAEADGVTDLLTDDDTRQQADDTLKKTAILQAQAQAMQMQAQAASHAQGNAPMPQFPAAGGGQ